MMIVVVVNHLLDVVVVVAVFADVVHVVDPVARHNLPAPQSAGDSHVMALSF